MNISDWLTENTKKLTDAGIGTGRLDCLVLLEDITGRDRAYLLAHPKTTVTGPTRHRLNRQIEQRVRHEPLAYIRGKTEFYGREFIVNKHVLEPRPESETMIELLKHTVAGWTCNVQGVEYGKTSHCKVQPVTVVDAGTGSGALAITAKLEFPDAEVIATDIDPNCLKVARQNAKKHAVDVTLLQGNLLEPLLETYDWRPTTGKFAILANLPYVPDSHTINQAAMQEPKIAIFGGPDGLDLYRKLFSQLSKNKQFRAVKYVLTESLPMQHSALAKIAEKHGYKQCQEDDFIQIFVKN